MKSKPKTIAEYLKTVPAAHRARFTEMLALIRSAAPRAEESIKWSMPAFSYTRVLVMTAPFTHHIGLYPTPKALKPFVKELAAYKTARGSIQFPFDKPLPKALIKKIVKFRVKESIERDGKWRS